MACRVCRTCNLSHENSTDCNPCPICGSETIYVADGKPDEDIVVAVKAALHLSPSQRGVIMWRRRRLVAMGFTGAMLEVLTESDVDLHKAQSMLDNGCSHDLLRHILL